MMTTIKFFTKFKSTENVEYKKVETLALELLEYMNTNEIQTDIKKAHKVGTSSSEIQNIILPKAIELGFSSEKKGLFTNHPSSGLRPDYYLKLNETNGIIMEVERGKTTANNMDLLDLWKCHICSEANYLFLIIPQYRQTKKRKKTKVFDTVKKRVTPFFEKTNYINVDALVIFGY